MPSDVLLAPRPRPVDSTRVRELMVLWQHPDTRAIIPIGRMAHEGDTYVFCYTRAAAQIADFRPLPGLGDLHQRYRSTHLPSVFGQRVMESDRPDYADYLHTIGLDEQRATPWEQIVHSGGERVGDTLQFMQLPTVTDGRACARFLVSGVRHIPDAVRTVLGRSVQITADQHETALQGLRTGDQVSVMAEQDNTRDECATLITTDGIPLGYVPQTLSTSVRELMDDDPVLLTVVRIGSPGTPPHLRLVVDLDVTAPSGFDFDREGWWQPLTAQ